MLTKQTILIYQLGNVGGVAHTYTPGARVSWFMPPWRPYTMAFSIDCGFSDAVQMKHPSTEASREAMVSSDKSTLMYDDGAKHTERKT